MQVGRLVFFITFKRCNWCRIKCRENSGNADFFSQVGTAFSVKIKTENKDSHLDFTETKSLDNLKFSKSFICCSTRRTRAIIRSK